MVLTPAEVQVPSQYSLCETCDYQIDSTALFYSTLIVPYHLPFHQYSILICIWGWYNRPICAYSINRLSLTPVLQLSYMKAKLIPSKVTSLVFCS